VVVFTRYYVRVTTGRPTCDPCRGSFKSYIRTCTRSAAIDELRKALRRTGREDLVGSLGGEIDGDDEEMSGDQKSLRRRVGEATKSDLGGSFEQNVVDSMALQHCLQCLPEKLHQVVVLSYRDRLSQADIAKRLNIRIGTVGSRLHRAYERLHQCMQGRPREGRKGENGTQHDEKRHDDHK
jgi:RNA polymerase sigma factor (sigma-70 family)